MFTYIFAIMLASPEGDVPGEPCFIPNAPSKPDPSPPDPDPDPDALLGEPLEPLEPEPLCSPSEILGIIPRAPRSPFPL